MDLFFGMFFSQLLNAGKVHSYFPNRKLWFSEKLKRTAYRRSFQKETTSSMTLKCILTLRDTRYRECNERPPFIYKTRTQTKVPHQPK